MGVLRNTRLPPSERISEHLREDWAVDKHNLDKMKQDKKAFSTEKKTQANAKNRHV